MMVPALYGISVSANDARDAERNTGAAEYDDNAAEPACDKPDGAGAEEPVCSKPDGAVGVEEK